MYIVYLLISSKNVLKSNQNALLRSINSGYDCRYALNYTEPQEFEKLCNIKRNFDKMKLLKLLESPTISLHEKVRRVEISEFYVKFISPNVTQGGLYKDWNFDIDF
jgi:hypothetical protein